MKTQHAPFGMQISGTTLVQGRQLFVTLLLCLVIGLSYFAPQGHDDQRILQLALLLIFSLTALVGWRRSTMMVAPDQRALRWSLLAFFLLGAVASASALSPRHAFLEESIFLMLLMLALCIAREIAQDSKRNILLTLKACALACMLYSLAVVVVYLTATILGKPIEADDFTPGFNNIRFFNHAQTISLPLLVLLFSLTKPNAKGRWAYFSLAAFWWTLLFVTSGRGTFVGLMAGCVGLLVLRRKHALGYCKSLLLTAFAGLAVYSVFFVMIPKMLGRAQFGLMGGVIQRTVADPASLRGALWERATELIAAHPWIGVGPLHFAHYAIDVQNGAHPHDWILQIGAEWGLPALVFLFSAIALALLGLVRTAAFIAVDDSDNQSMLAAWIVTGLAILVDGLVSGSIVMPVSQMLIALYIGCAAGWSMSFQKGEPARLYPASQRVLGAVLLFTAMGGVAIGIAPDISNRGRHPADPAKDAAWYRGELHPRIWMAGYF